jgi:hypothetical protein
MISYDLPSWNWIEQLAIAKPGLLCRDNGKDRTCLPRSFQVKPAVSPFCEKLNLPFPGNGIFELQLV